MPRLGSSRWIALETLRKLEIDFREVVEVVKGKL
jgi:hypothetical protein